MQRNQTRRDFLRLKSPTSAPVASPTYTTNEAFFRQQLRHVPPVASTFWALTLGGLVRQLLVLRHTDFLALPSAEIEATLVCVGSTPAHPLIGHARWRGIPLRSLLEQVEPMPEAAYAQFYSADGYTTFVETERLTDAVLAYEMNGEPLSPEHGFPVRLVVPGRYGYKMPKWLQRIQLTDSPVNGFWEERGWPASGAAQTVSGIISPHHLKTISGEVLFSGFAYAGEHTITHIELSIDDAPWMPVTFTASTPGSWVTWNIRWTPPAPGDYLVKVRAGDSSGFVQPDETPARSSGSNSAQRIIVRVTA